MLSLAAWADDLELDAEVEARAYGGGLDDPYDHPLLDSSALDVVAEGSRTTDELIRDLHLYSRTTVDDDGTVTRWQGAELVDSEPAEELTADEDRGELDAATLPIVAPSLVDLLSEGAASGAGDTGAGEELELVLSLDALDWNPIVSVEQELYIAMLEGRIETRRDALAVRQDAMVQRAAAGQAALAPLLADLDALGVEVVETTPITGSVQVVARTDQLAELVALEGLAHVDRVAVDEVSAGYPTGSEVSGPNIDGEEVENLLQTTQYYDDGVYGDADGYIGLEEGNSSDGGHLVRRTHLGFDDGSGADRWTNCGAPDSAGTCWVNSTPDPGNEHATGVASVLLGDLTLGQDSGISLNGRVPRSGVARRAEGLGAGTSSDTTVAIMTVASRDIHMMNHSAGSEHEDCTGTSDYAQDWNSLYESGVAVFMAAGNNQHVGKDCQETLKDPASALGVFTVGAFQVTALGAEETRSSQSRGGGQFYNGSTYVDDGRTLLDVQGATRHEYAYSEDGAASQQYPGDIDGTSGAAPTVTGAAALFRDCYLAEEGTAIDAPGLLYAHLLLMGDRIDESGSYLDTGFDEVTGAGRLRMRKYDNLDGPAGWGDGVLCVADGSVATIDFAPLGMSADVDMVKAVIWWYDHRHDSGTRHDKVDLRLQRYNSLSETWTTVQASTTNDNKQRVFLDSPTTFPYRLRIKGRDVTSDWEGCGLNATRVYYAWLYEDQDRDTGTDLDDQVRPEE